jgi:Putative bacterial sensory transduction regulator
MKLARHFLAPVARRSHARGGQAINLAQLWTRGPTGVNVRFNIFRYIAAIIVASWACLGSVPLLAQSATPRVEQSLKETGFSYKTHNANTWSIEFERKTLGKFRVIMSTGGSDILVTFVILAKKANINKTPKMMETLLTANHDYDYVKVGLDIDGDLFVRIDNWLPTLSSGRLKDTINQVANASEEVFVKVANSIRR